MKKPSRIHEMKLPDLDKLPPYPEGKPGVLRANDMDVVDEVFGIRFDGDLVELYLEDDEFYHLKTIFHKHWLKSLDRIVKKAIQQGTR